MHDVIETDFHELQEAKTCRNGLLSCCCFKISGELLFKQAVAAAYLLLFSKLNSKFRLFFTLLTVLSGWITPALECALAAVAAGALQKELGAFIAAQFAY